MATHRADERAFLDERGSNATEAPNGLNPASIMEKAVIERITDAYFYKDQCFAINEADIVDRCVREVRFVGGTYGASQKPTPFLCLAFKLLQLAPDDATLAAYLDHGGERFKYLRALAAFYVRLTRRAVDVYKTLEPLLEDKRKLRRKGQSGTTLTFVDQFVDDLLTKERVCGVTLLKMPKREMLEELDELEPRVSPLGDIEDLLEEEDLMEGVEVNGDEPRGSEDEGVVEEQVRSERGGSRRSLSRSNSRPRSRTRSRSRSKPRGEDRDGMDVDGSDDSREGRQ